MKSKTISNLIFIIGAVILILLSLMGLSVSESDPEMTIIMMTFALTIFVMFYCSSISHDLVHVENILKKHGLWQDESIKKNELNK